MQMMSKVEEPSKAGSCEALKKPLVPTTEIEIGPQRRKRMPAGRHLDAVTTVVEPPKAPLKISEQLQAQLKNPERPASQPKSSEQSSKGLQGEIQVK